MKFCRQCRFGFSGTLANNAEEGTGVLSDATEPSSCRVSIKLETGSIESELHSPHALRIVFDMRARQLHPLLRYTALTLLLATVPSCGGAKKYDWKNRDISWAPGPTKGGATYEHLTGTGTKGAGAIADGWKCKLVDGKRLTVRPYQLAKTHVLFGKVKMTIGLFDKTGKQIETLRSDAITAENATFSFELTEAVAKPLYDVIIWFGKL